MDCTENYTRFAIEVSEYLRCLEKAKKQESCQTSISGNGGAKPIGDEEFVQTVQTSKSLILKHEKPNLPIFYGDVRKYFTFPEHFKYAVENRCDEKDSMTILCSCLGPEPGKLIQGISSDSDST